MAYGKRFVVRADENLSIAKALPKERQPRHGAIALRLPTATVPEQGHIRRVFLHTPPVNRLL